MELAEIVTNLKEHDAAEVADALRQSAPDLYQALYQRGFSTAHGEAKAKLEAKDAEIAAARAEIEKAQAEMKAALAKAPDIDSVRSDYEKRLQTLEAEKKAALEEGATRVQTLYKDRFKAELQAALIAEHIDPDYAREVLVNKYDGRVQVDAEGRVKVLDEDGLTPLQAANGELAPAFARKIRAAVDPKWIRSAADGGAGVQSGGASAQTVTVKSRIQEKEQSGEYAL